MQTIINAIEDMIFSKKQELRYQQDEIDRMSANWSRTSSQISALEAELATLKDSITFGTFQTNSLKRKL